MSWEAQELQEFLTTEFRKINRNGGVGTEVNVKVLVLDLFLEWWKEQTSGDGKVSHDVASRTAMQVSRQVTKQSGKIAYDGKVV